MNPTTIKLSLSAVQRLAVAKQRLAGVPYPANTRNVARLVKEIGCLQLDPINVVARNHLLVLWSRFGNFDRGTIDSALWNRRTLFEYWAHMASIVPSRDYALHAVYMRNFGKRGVAWEERLAAWARSHAALRRRIMKYLQTQGAGTARDFEGDAPRRAGTKGWSNYRDVHRMLDYMWFKGQVLVARRNGIERVWDLPERLLAKNVLAQRLRSSDADQACILRSLDCLGAGTLPHIKANFVRGRYANAAKVLEDLVNKEAAAVVTVLGKDGPLPGTWYIQTKDLDAAQALTQNFSSRVTLLSPFDNLIADRKRTHTLFAFTYKSQLYIPQKLRRGYYVMPILAGDRLVGRLDPQLNRRTQTLHVHELWWEPGVNPGKALKRSLKQTVENLASFTGANNVTWPGAFRVS